MADKLNDLGNISFNVPHEYRDAVNKLLKKMNPTEMGHRYFDWANLLEDAKRVK